MSSRWLGIRTSTGDLLALPLAVGITIGRIGCFLTGLSDGTFGRPSSLPWAVDFSDGIRHVRIEQQKAAAQIDDAIHQVAEAPGDEPAKFVESDGI